MQGSVLRTRMMDGGEGGCCSPPEASVRFSLGIKHRSTEHNSSLMVSESEFDSDQDTIFSRERMERGNPKVSVNGSIRNGASFSYCSKDR